MATRKPDKSVQRRLQIESTLADYPNLPSDKLIDLIYWFKREATATEVARVASNPSLQSNYRAFHKNHLDRLSAGELIVTIGVGIVLLVAMAAIIIVP